MAGTTISDQAHDSLRATRQVAWSALGVGLVVLAQALTLVWVRRSLLSAAMDPSWWGPGPVTMTYLLDAVPLAVLAVVVAARGRAPGPRLRAAAVVLAGLALDVLLTHEQFQELSQLSRGAPWWPRPTMVVVLPMLPVLAWGLARRRGRWWLLSVPLAALLAHAASTLPQPGFTYAPDPGPSLARLVLVTSGPLVLAGLVGWLLDVTERRVTRP